MRLGMKKSGTRWETKSGLQSGKNEEIEAEMVQAREEKCRCPNEEAREIGNGGHQERQRQTEEVLVGGDQKGQRASWITKNMTSNRRV